MNRGSRIHGAARVTAVVAGLVLSASGCGRRTHAARHTEAEATAAPVPTPDNTPVTLLRTPAGLVLKTEEPTPHPGHEPTPAPSAAPATTP